MSNAIQWRGEQAFYIAGTEHDDDTLRIVVARGQGEDLLSLVLPTLCITFADMRFANAIGGRQEEYPHSARYGPAYFTPPVVIRGEQEIEKLTWIRGAQRMTIGPEETRIEWYSSRTLVIPKLRIEAGEKVQSVLVVPQVTITLTQPFFARIKQYADGRHVGGVQVLKRHPDWQPAPAAEVYHLWVRAVDRQERRAISRARVTLYTWQAGEQPEEGEFVAEATWYTDEMGIVDAPGLPCGGKKTITVEAGGWQRETWRFRPLPGQPVRRTFLLSRE